MESTMTIPMKTLLRMAILPVCALTLGACVYDGPYRDRDYDGWHHSHYYGHDDGYRHDHDRGDVGHDGD
jgi:hypothetical protein